MRSIDLNMILGIMNYWLLKTEPATFSIQDLKKRKREPWDGVRNYQARNTLRDLMAEGDLALFYHSNSDPSGIVGICKIASPALPDATAFNSKSKYFDPTSNPEKPRWWLREVEFVEEFKSVISLAQLREIDTLQDMQVLRKGQRLSVLPVTPEEFKTIIKLAK